MQRGFIIFKQLITLFILFSLSISTFAQTKKTAPKTIAKQTCNGGWNGVVSFRKTLKKSRDYGKRKISPEARRITNTHAITSMRANFLSMNPKTLLRRTQYETKNQTNFILDGSYHHWIFCGRHSFSSLSVSTRKARLRLVFQNR